MSLKASITRPAARIAKLERLTATRAFDRKLISEEYDKAIIERVVTGAKLGEAEPLRVYFRHLRHRRILLSLWCRRRSAKRKPSPSPNFQGKRHEQR